MERERESERELKKRNSSFRKVNFNNLNNYIASHANRRQLAACRLW